MTRIANGERGYALVAVLWASILFSVIAGALISQARFAARIESNEWRRLEIEKFAEAATAIALHALLNAGVPSSPILAGAWLSGEWKGTPFDYAFHDETGKIDLNETDAETLTKALRSVGKSAKAAGVLARAVIDWRAPNRSSSADAAPTFRRFQSVAELMLVEGFDASLVRELTPALTVYAQSSAVNPDYSSETTLHALYPGERARVDALLAQRRLATDIAVREFLRAPSNQQGGSNGRAVAVTLSFEMHGKPRAFQTIVRVTGAAERPYLLLHQQRLK